MSLCEENCEFVDYNYTSKKAVCSCEVKLEVAKDFDIKFDKKDFFKSFIDIKNLFNFNVLKCFKTVMKIKELMKNFGFFFISSIILFYIVTLLIFSFYSFHKLKMNISKIVLELRFNDLHQQKNDIYDNNNDKVIDNNNDNINKSNDNSNKIIIEDIISDNSDNKSNNTIIGNNNTKNNADILIMKSNNKKKKRS